MDRVVLINNFKATLYENLTTSSSSIKMVIQSPSTSEMALYSSELTSNKIIPLIIINNANSNDYEIIYINSLSSYSGYYSANIYVRGAENTIAKNWDKNSCYIICGPTAFLLMQYNSLRGVMEPSPLKNSNSLELQINRTNDGYTATKGDCIVIGGNNKADVSKSILIGFNNTSSPANSSYLSSANAQIILGYNNTFTYPSEFSYTNSIVIIGGGNNVSGVEKIYTIGSGNNISTSSNIFVVGENNTVNTSTFLKTYIIGSNHNINVTDSKFYEHSFISIGDNNNIIGSGGTISSSTTALVIGENCRVARGSILLGGKNDILGVPYTISFGNRVGVITGGIGGSGISWTMRSNPFEIGGAAPTYANNTTYYYGDIVRHPTDTNKYCQLTNLTIDLNTGTYPSYSSSSYNANDWTEFTKTPPTNYTWFNVQEGMFFIPTDLYILIWRFSTLSGTPSISIGTASNPGLILNNYNFVPTSSTAYYQIPLPNPTNYVQGPETVILRVNTLSTSGRALCVALLTGFFTIAPEATTF